MVKGYLMYKVENITFKREYVKNINDIDKVGLYLRYINFKSGIIKKEQENVSLIFKGKVLHGKGS